MTLGGLREGERTTSAPTLNHVASVIQQCDQQYVAIGHGTAILELESFLCSKGVENLLKESNPFEILSLIESELDARNHQVGCLFLLDHVSVNHKSELAQETEGTTPSLLFSDFMRVACSFLGSCSMDDYIGYSSVSKKRLGSLCMGVGTLAVSCGISKRVIVPLFSGLKCMVQGRWERITPVHHVVLQACLAARCYWKGETLLDRQGRALILHAPQVYNTTSDDVLLYFYCAGMIYTGLKQYEKALDMFVGVVVMPMFQVNDLMMDAMKKYILVSLIVHGAVKTLPSYTSNVIKRTLSSEYEEYMGLAEHVKMLVESGAAAVMREAEEYVRSRHETWKKDNNFGLVQIVMDQQKERVLKRLCAMYTRMPKRHVAAELGLLDPDEVDKVLLKFRGTVHASIDDIMGLVCFEDAENIRMKELLESIQQCLTMKQTVDEDSHQIQCSPGHILQRETQKMASTSLK